MTVEVTHIDPPRTWGVRGVDGPIRATVEVTVEPLAATRSRLTITVDFEGHGIGRVLVPLVVRREARQEMPEDLATLRKRLERSASAAQSGARDTKFENRTRRSTVQAHAAMTRDRGSRDHWRSFGVGPPRNAIDDE